MAGEDCLRCRSPQTVAVLLLLCTLAPSLSGFSLQGLSRNAKQGKVVSEASRVEIRTGSILFNGKELNSESGSSSAAATNDDGLLHVDTDQPEGSGMFEEPSQLNEVMANEGAWRRLNPALHCGQTKMKFIAMGPGAADLQLDIGNEHPLPLTQLPESCGFSLQTNALGLVLVAPYDACNAIQENGNYVVSMTWLEAEVKLICPILPSPDATPAPHPWNHPVPHRLSSFYRPKRHVAIYDPSPYFHLYYSHLNQNQATAPTTTTAEPDTTTTSQLTTATPQNPPVYPPYMYYPYYFYFPYYYYYPLPQSAPATTAPATTAPATTAPATTAPATTAPATTAPSTTAPSTTADSTTAPSTTADSTTAVTTQKPMNPFYPIYYPYPHAGGPLPMFPDNADVYYYPIIQHIYGTPPYPSNPMETTTQPPTSTTNPSGTTKPSETSPTAPATTASTTTTTTKPTTSSSGSYPGQLSPFVEYNESPFAPVISYAYNKAGKLPDYQNHLPQNGYKSGPQAQAHSGYYDWRAAPWFFPSTK